MKWQNLVKGLCPDCQGKLEPIKGMGGIVYECMNRRDCLFTIRKQKLIDTLKDKTHMLRRYLTKEEVAKLDALDEPNTTA